MILREGLSVRGLNTAATLWCSAAIGGLAGLGFTAAAVVTTGAVIVTNLALRPLGRRLDRRLETGAELEVEYRIEVTCPESEQTRIRAALLDALGRQPLMVRRVRAGDVRDTDDVRIEVVVISDGRSHRTVEQVTSQLSREPRVSSTT